MEKFVMEAKMCGLLEQHKALPCWEGKAEDKNTTSIPYFLQGGAVGCKQSGLKILIFFNVLTPWLYGWLRVASLCKLFNAFYLNVKGYGYHK